MTHEMKLNASPFKKIKSGAKTIELRLYDEKRRKIQVGDNILFRSAAGVIKARVIALHNFPDFEALYASLPLEKCGYTASTLASAGADDMLAYYTREQIKKYGVVGIEIEVEACLESE